MINLVNITQHYRVRPVLRQVNLKIEGGILTGLMGPNGMGKSTLLGVMAGVLSPQKGYVEIKGRRRRGSVEDERLIRKQTVYLPDHPWLPQNITGREFLLAVVEIQEDLAGCPVLSKLDQVSGHKMKEKSDLPEHGGFPLLRKGHQ